MSDIYTAPSKNSVTNSHNAPSKHVVVQLAMRAIRRVHLDAQLFSLGQTGKTARSRLPGMNRARGAEVALETTVHDAFAQEFNSSKLTHGWVVPEDGGDRRYWTIERQTNFKIEAEERSRPVDLVLRRIDPDKPQDYTYQIGPIELKRARLFRPNLATGDATRESGNELEAVRKDITKLAGYVRASRVGKLIEPNLNGLTVNKGEDKLHPHVLVWGVTNDEGDPVASCPVAFMDAVFKDHPDNVARKDLRFDWFPSAWTEPVEKEDVLDKAIPSVVRWVWVAYAEIEVRP